MGKKPKYEKPIKVDMGFDEMMGRLVRVDKAKVEANIKKAKTTKKPK